MALSTAASVQGTASVVNGSIAPFSVADRLSDIILIACQSIVRPEMVGSSACC